METSGPSRLIVAKYLGGSHAYGLNTPESDLDERSVFISTKLSHILGLQPDDFTKKQNEEEDSFSTEIRYFVELLRRSSTSSVECLFTSNFEFLDPIFELNILANKRSLLDPHKFISSTLGYVQNERRLAAGERTGKLGSKRKLQLEKYGFSPKNYTNLFRLAWCAEQFILTGEYPLNIKDTPVFDFLYAVKTTPEKFTADELRKISEDYEDGLKKAKETLDAPGFTQYKFDHDQADMILLNCYKPTLLKYV